MPKQDLRIDLGQMTLRQMKEFKELTGKGFQEVSEEERQEPEFLVNVAYVVLHKNNPDLTIDDCWEIPITSFGQPSTDPTSATNVNTGSDTSPNSAPSTK